MFWVSFLPHRLSQPTFVSANFQPPLTPQAHHSTPPANCRQPTSPIPSRRHLSPRPRPTPFAQPRRTARLHRCTTPASPTRATKNSPPRTPPSTATALPPAHSGGDGSTRANNGVISHPRRTTSSGTPQPLPSRSVQPFWTNESPARSARVLIAQAAAVEADVRIRRAVEQAAGARHLRGRSGLQGAYPPAASVWVPLSQWQIGSVRARVCTAGDAEGRDRRVAFWKVAGFGRGEWMHRGF